MVINYIAYNPEGERLSGSVEANSTQAAEAILIRSNLTVVSLKKEFRFPKLSLDLQKQLPTIFRPKAQELVGFSRELANLLDSGISLLPAIRLIHERIRGSLFKQALIQIAQDIEMGGSFSKACSKHPAIFPPMYIRLIAIGESTGRLGVMLQQAAIHIEKQLEMRKKVKKAIRYPAVVILIGIAAFAILVNVTLPALTGLLEEVGGELPLNARMLLATSNFLTSYGMYILAGIIAAIFIGWRYFRTASGKIRREKLQIRIPMVRGVSINSNVANFSRTLSTLLAAGIPLTEAIELTINATDSTIMRNALMEVREDLLTGQQLSTAISRQKVFPNVVSQMVSVGEQAGTLQQNLDTLSDLYEKSTNESVDSLTGFIQPMIVIIAGGMIGFIMITLMQSIYGAIGQMK